MSSQLTKYPQGSLRELWTLAYPMILAFLSGNIMMFADRLFLANYSTAAMNAAAAAGMVVIVMQYGAAIVTAIAEVFVGQFNGAKEYKKAASPTVQMLWFSLFLTVIYFFMSKYMGSYLISDYYYEEHGLPYYQWMLYFAACTPAISALSGFFVGVGHTRYVMVITIVGNVINLILDPLLIFGYSTWISPMGTKGAAIATGIAALSQVLIFLSIFLSRHYREKYNTSNWSFHPKQLYRYLKVGVPNSVGHMIEWAAWAISLNIMASISENHLTVATVGQSFYMLVAFSFEGVQKAVTTIAANHIGAGSIDGVWKSWRTGIKLLFISCIPLSIILIGYPDPLIAEFLSMETPPSDVILLTYYLKLTAIGVFLYYILDGLTWISVGVLTAAEDTFYVMWVNAVTSWFAALLPVYVCMVYLEWSPVWYYFLTCFYGGCNALIFYKRLQSGAWQKAI